MRWSDISVLEDHQITKDFADDNEGINEVLKIRVSADTKMGRPRTLFSQPEAAIWMWEWKKISRYPNEQDLVWYGQSKVGDPQVPATDLNKTFQSFLRSVEYKGREGGLLFDADGGKRSLYSIWHFYAT